MRSIQFANNEYYHIYNRGVDKQKYFFSMVTIPVSSQQSVISSIQEARHHAFYNQGLALKSKVALLCYCLMPNHYHLLLHQTTEPGVTEFMHKLDTSYTMFLTKQPKDRKIFESTFKATKIESEEQLLHVSRYIHLNPVIARLVENRNNGIGRLIGNMLDLYLMIFATQTNSFLCFRPTKNTSSLYLTGVNMEYYSRKWNTRKKNTSIFPERSDVLQNFKA